MTPRRANQFNPIYGCTNDAASAANGGRLLSEGGTRAIAYTKQRLNARARGIEWLITFPEWVGVWMASGYFDRRGKGFGCYCMARHGDAGPYAIDNVSIQLVEVNSKEVGDRNALRLDYSAFARRRRGSGRGWTLIPGSKKRPYQVTIGGKYVGSYATQVEAEAAYAAAV